MPNDARGVRKDAGIGRKLCAWAAAAFLLTFLWLAFFVRLAPDLAPPSSAAAPGRPSVSC